MTTQAPELKGVLDRLARLERQNRRLRGIVLAGLSLIVAAWIISEARPGKRIEAREFVLTDSSGAVRATLAVKAGEARLTLLDSQGNPRAIFAPHGPQRLASYEVSVNRESISPRTGAPPDAEIPSGVSEPVMMQASGAHLLEARLDAVGTVLPAATRARDEQAASFTPLVSNALHSLVPALAKVRDESAGAWRAIKDAALTDPERSHAELTADSQETVWPHAAQLADLSGAPRLSLENQTGRAPLDRFAAREGNPAALAPSTPESSSGERQAVTFKPDRREVPADVPLVKWNQARTLPAPDMPQLARNPFEFAGQSAKIKSSITLRAVDKIPVAPVESLPAVPPVALKALGYAESPGSAPQAILSDDINIYVVRTGDFFGGRFQVLDIGPTGVDLDDRLAGHSLRLVFNP